MEQFKSELKNRIIDIQKQERVDDQLERNLLETTDALLRATL